MNQPIFPIFNEKPKRNPVPVIHDPKPKEEPLRKEQKTRWDKCHTMKFPVTKEDEQELRRLYKRYKIKYQATSITAFTTMLEFFTIILKSLKLFKLNLDPIEQALELNLLEFEEIQSLNQGDFIVVHKISKNCNILSLD